MKRRALVWFRQDLRLHDNEAISTALRMAEEIIPVYVFDDRVFKGTTRFGFPKINKHRAQFIIESVEDLSSSIQKLGNVLQVKTGYAEDMIAEMQPNSVIIDVSIDQGGCFETSHLTDHKNPIFRKHDVIHYCVPNIASRVARTASTALSNIFTPMLLQIAKKGGVDDLIYSRDWFMKGVYAYKGFVTNPYIAKKFELKYRDMNLLIAARF